MNVKKYLTMLAGAALLTACTSDEPAIGPAPDGNGQAGTPGSVTFRIDGLAGGSTVQSKAEGDNMIASAKENEIQLLDILVFAYCGADGTTPVDPTKTTPPSEGDLAKTEYWKLQEVHYYSANNPTDQADPFYRPAPPEVGSEGSITAENYVRQFQLQGTGTFRSATITPIKGMGADDKRYLRFVLIANSNSVYDPDGSTDGVPNTIHSTNAENAMTLKELYQKGITPFKNGDIISCPLLMVGNPVAGAEAKAYVNTNDLTAAPSNVLSMSATLKRAVARFDIINETPHDFTLTQVEIPYLKFLFVNTLRPTKAPGGNTKYYSVNLPTLDKADENGNPYWSTTNTDAMALNSAFYTSASYQRDGVNTEQAALMKLTVHGKIGNQSLEKEIDLKVSDGAGGFTYDIAPNTRYRLRISYRGGLQALMEVVDWSDDYTNPELSNPQTPVIIAPANNVIISDGFNPDNNLCPYTGWFWDDRTKYQELFPKWELGTHYAVMIPNNTNLEGTGLENSQPKEIAETLAFDIATKDETTTFPFAFEIVNALTPDKPNTAWLRTHTYGATQDATDKKLWHVKLVAVEGAVNNMETLDPLKIRVYDKENPEYYAFIDVLQPADYPLTTVRTKIEYGRVQTSYFSGNTKVTLPEDLVSMRIYHTNGDRICSFGAYDANGRQYENMTWAVLRKGANPADPVTVTFNPDYTGTDFSDIFLKIFPEGDETNYYIYRLIHYSNNK